MNEKEAREIIKQGQNWKLEKDETVTLKDILERSISVAEQYSGAEKYLEAIEKAKGLVEVMTRLREAEKGYDEIEKIDARRGYVKAFAQYEEGK